MVAAHLVVSAQLSCYAFCCSLQTCYLFIPELPLCFGGKQFMFMSKIHESLSKCIYSSFVEVITKVLNTLIQTARVPWILNLVTRKKKEKKRKACRVSFQWEDTLCEWFLSVHCPTASSSAVALFSKIPWETIKIFGKHWSWRNGFGFWFSLILRHILWPQQRIHWLIRALVN